METELVDVTSRYYYSNVTIYSHLWPAMAEHSVCVGDELSSLDGNLTGRTSGFLSGCLSMLNSCTLGSLACPSGTSCPTESLSSGNYVDVWRSLGNLSRMWVLDTMLESGYDLTVTVDDTEHPEIRPKRFEELLLYVDVNDRHALIGCL